MRNKLCRPVYIIDLCALITIARQHCRIGGRPDRFSLKTINYIFLRVARLFFFFFAPHIIFRSYARKQNTIRPSLFHRRRQYANNTENYVPAKHFIYKYTAVARSRRFGKREPVIPPRYLRAKPE